MFLGCTGLLAKQGLLAEGEHVLSLWTIFIKLPKIFFFMGRKKIERSNRTHTHMHSEIMENISCHFIFIVVPSLV